jgi:hypothetical protein
MGSECSLSSSQEPATCEPHPEPVHTIVLQHQFHPPIYNWYSQMTSPIQVFRLKCYDLIVIDFIALTIYGLEYKL